MTSHQEIDISIREAIPNDAKSMLAFIKQVSNETNFVYFNQELTMTSELEALAIDDIYDADNACLLLAFDESRIIGLVSVSAEDAPGVRHIGELGISILKDYWGLGLGHLLMDEVDQWAVQSSSLRRIQLTVQQRNMRAIRLYSDFDYHQEAIIQRGYEDPVEGFIPVVMMSKLIN